MTLGGLDREIGPLFSGLRPMIRHYLLYGTEHCHLCDVAAALLCDAGVAVEKVDIANDEALCARYELRIPVLHCREDGHELDWPFDAQRLRAFLAR